MDLRKPPATVHIDLDGASAIYSVHGWPYPHDTDPLFESGLENLLFMLDTLDIKATLFVIASDLDNPRKRELLCEAVARGHSIGCHSWTHRRLTSLSREQKLHEIKDSRERISSVLGVPVDGFRAPYFDIDGETHRMVAEADYRYDSSLFPGRDIPLGNSHMEAGQLPEKLWPDLAMIELPLPHYAPLPFPFHASYSLVLGYWYFRLGLWRHRRIGAPLVLLFHLTDLADPLPGTLRKGWKSTFFTLSWLTGASKQRRCTRMLDEVARHYRLVDTSTLLDEAVTQDK
jgi:peptidoglycan/xylan/chitin deacetylase (PgdA/CDA1 family)